MPETYKETEFKGHPMFEVYIGQDFKTKEDKYWGFGLKKAQAILDNIDALRRWVDKHEGGKSPY